MKEHNGKVYIEENKHDFEELKEIVTILRSPEGCSWDRAQTHESMKKCLIDETNEVLTAIENGDYENLCEELGDVLLQVLLHAEIAKENGKLIRRHPHVFGDVKRPETPEESLALWQSVKKIEKERKQNKNK